MKYFIGAWAVGLIIYIVLSLIGVDVNAVINIWIDLTVNIILSIVSYFANISYPWS